MTKPWISLTIDQELLQKIDHERGKKISEENKNISRSAFICELVTKGLKRSEISGR